MADYAPIYSKRERIRLALVLAAVLAPLVLLAQFWLFPAMTHYSGYANCFNFDGVTGVEVVSYGMFVVIPLSSTLVVLLLMGPRSLRVLKAGQDPLPGEKVLRKTRYRYGRAALWYPLLTLAVALAFVGMAIWGSFQVDKMTLDIVPCNEQKKAELGRYD